MVRKIGQTTLRQQTRQGSTRCLLCTSSSGLRRYFVGGCYLRPCAVCFFVIVISSRFRRDGTAGIHLIIYVKIINERPKTPCIDFGAMITYSVGRVNIQCFPDFALQHHCGPIAMVDERLKNMPANVQAVLAEFVASAREVFGDNIAAIILYGSAAEGRMRPASDVNLLMVFKQLTAFDLEKIGDSYRHAHQAIKLNAMFIRESELDATANAFAVKFNDIVRRNIVLSGENVLQTINISRAAALQRLNQVLLNLMLRLREKYVLMDAEEERIRQAVISIAGPIRSAALSILLLEGEHHTSPKAALASLTVKLGGSQWAPVLEALSEVREGGELHPDQYDSIIDDILSLLTSMHNYVTAME